MEIGKILVLKRHLDQRDCNREKEGDGLPMISQLIRPARLAPQKNRVIGGSSYSTTDRSHTKLLKGHYILHVSYKSLFLRLLSVLS
jgi:hypothetical protein